MSSATTTGSSQVLTDVGRPGLVDIPDGRSAAEARRAPLDVLTVERARDGETDAFFANKLTTGRFFLARILPDTKAHLEKIRSGAEPLMSLAADAF